MTIATLKYHLRDSFTRLLTTAFPQTEKRMRFGHYLDSKGPQNTLVEPELFILPLLVPPQGTFIDIGANRGEYLFAVERHRTDAALIGFEPIPELAWALARLFPGATIERCALSDKPGQASFKIPYLKGRPMPTRGTLETDYREPGEEAMKTLHVTLDTLDLWCQQHGIVPGLIKIDVEGHEWTVLAGAHEVLRTHTPLLMVEIEQRHHPEHLIWESIQAFRQQYGYRVFFYAANTGTFSELTEPSQIRQAPEDHKTRSYINNFFFFPAQQADVLAQKASSAR